MAEEMSKKEAKKRLTELKGIIEKTPEGKFPEREVLHQLAATQQPEALEILKKLYEQGKDTDWRRYEVAYALQNFKHPAALPLITHIVKNDSDAVNQSVALSAISAAKLKEGIPLLLESLNSPEPYVRQHAASALGSLKAEEAVQPLLKLLAKEKDKDCLHKTIEALGKIGKPEIVEPLLPFLKHRDWGVRGHAIGAVGQFKRKDLIPQLAEGLRDRNSWVRSHAVWALAKTESEEALAHLRKAAKIRGKKWENETLTAIAGFGKTEDIPFMVRNLGRSVIHATKALDTLENSGDHYRLFREVNEKGLDSPAAMGLRLKNAIHPKLVPSLLERLKGQRRMLGWILYDVKEYRNAHELSKLMWALRLYGGKEAEKPLLGMLKEKGYGENPSIWRSAIENLGHVAGEKSIPILLEKLNHEKLDSAAVEALGRITERLKRPRTKEGKALKFISSFYGPGLPLSEEHPNVIAQALRFVREGKISEKDRAHARLTLKQLRALRENVKELEPVV